MRQRASSSARSVLCFFVVLLAALVSTLSASEYDVIIHEIHYHPFRGDRDGEFLEIYNRGGTAVDLSGWSLGEGVRFVFPTGTRLPPKGFVVLSPNRAETIARYGVDPEIVHGDYDGGLDNAGEIIALYSFRGEVIQRISFGDGGVWPSRADGLGPSLELRDPFAQWYVPSNWQASLTIDGTPGRRNSVAEDVRPAPVLETVLIEDNEVWRYIKGDVPFPDGWRDVDFDDSAWLAGPTGIGYDDDDDATVLDDMREGYLSFIARKRWVLEAEDLESLGRVVFSIDFDDGFAAHLNGQEVARRNLGSAGDDTAFDVEADGSREAGSAASFLIDPSLLREGDNVLAVQIHNQDIDSSDASFVPRLVSLPTEPFEPADDDLDELVINEVKPTESASAGFIELLKRYGEPEPLDGLRIVDSHGHRFTISGGGQISAGERIVLDDTTLGFDLALSGVRYAVLRSDGVTWVDGINPRPGTAGLPDDPVIENGYSFGRFPDGDDDAFVLVDPSRDGENELDLSRDIVVNEVLFHPVHVPSTESCPRNCSDVYQWIELYNRGEDAVSLARWSLTKAVAFDFPEDTSIPAGGFLVVASSREDFLVANPTVDPALVVGNWTRDLSHSSDTINLRDQRGNLVDHVRYGDGKPRNDEVDDSGESRPDGNDDGTFLGTDWPVDADGNGRTLELVHPELDNRSGGAWRSSLVEGGTPAALNGVFDDNPAPVIGDVDHSPAIPTSADPVLVTARVSSVGALASVRVLWRVDGGGASGSIDLLDDGIAGDERAGDGVFTGTIPPQPSDATVAFQIEASAAGDLVSTVPRPPRVAPYDGFEGPFFLYRVSNEDPLANPSPDYFLIMTQADEAELQSRDLDSNVLLYATFMARTNSGKMIVRQLSGLRYRGSATRDNDPRPFRVEFPPERDFEGVQAINLNSSEIEHEILAADLWHRAGAIAPVVHTINLTFQGETQSRYVRKERLDAKFLERALGRASDGGNLYRAINPSGDGPEGDLSYLGEDKEAYRVPYEKRSNDEEDDYSDIIALTRAFDPIETPDDVFVETIESVLDARQWSRFFALQSAIANDDGGIQSTSGEDYFLYRIPETSNLGNAGKFILIPWDIEESYDDRSEPLFNSSFPTVRRFLTHPRFAPLYYCDLMNLRFGVFSRLEIRQAFRLIEFLFGFSTIDGIDQYITARIGFFDENVPMRLRGGSEDVTGRALIAEGDLWRYFLGTSEPSGGNLAWTSIDFDDSDWLEGPSGFGYGDGDDATSIPEMEDSFSTLYIRKTFDIDNPANLLGLELAIDYDDAFVAFLNGVEIARRNLGDPGTFVPVDETGADDHEAGNPESFDLGAFLDVLEAGENVLAIQGVNGSLGSSDFSLIPELRRGGTTEAGIGCGAALFASSDTIGLVGQANACETLRVEVDGNEAEYDASRGEWRASATLDPGLNTVVVESFNAFGVAFERLEISVQRIDGGLTSVVGDLDAATVWTSAGGPYLLRGDVVVPQDGTLTIEPGTVVFANSGASIIVLGLLDAQGTEQEPILFRASSCDGRWGGIAMDGTGVGAEDPTHILRHCDFEFGDTPSGYDGHVAPVDAKLLADRCDFRLITANAIDGTDARLEVMGCTFEDIHEGVHATRSVVIVLESHFRNMVGDKDAIDFDFNSTEINRIERCTFVNGSDDGIDLGDTSVIIRDNVFINIQDKALSLEDNGPFGPPVATGNVIYRCGTAMALKSGVTIEEGDHNTLVGNQEGVNLFAKDDAPDGGHATLHSMIIWNNAFDVKIDEKSSVSFTHSNISQGVFPGVGNISVDPEFIDVLLEDFALRPTSPCIGTGLGGTDMGAVPFEGRSPPFVRGDVDEDGDLDLTDMVAGVAFLFQGARGPRCIDRVDTNDDGAADVSDVVYGLRYLFAGGMEPPEPFPALGFDPTEDAIPCR